MSFLNEAKNISIMPVYSLATLQCTVKQEIHSREHEEFHNHFQMGGSRILKMVMKLLDLFSKSAHPNKLYRREIP